MRAEIKPLDPAQIKAEEAQNKFTIYYGISGRECYKVTRANKRGAIATYSSVCKRINYFIVFGFGKRAYMGGGEYDRGAEDIIKNW